MSDNISVAKHADGRLIGFERFFPAMGQQRCLEGKNGLGGVQVGPLKFFNLLDFIPR